MTETPTTDLYLLSLHDALPISAGNYETARRPRGTRVFPYATLFRSLLEMTKQRTERARHEDDDEQAEPHAQQDVLRVRRLGRDCRAEARPGRRTRKDRKSTRLNSSH